MLPAEFERRVLTFFASRGYMVSWTGGAGDGGKDGVVRDWGGHVYIVQCKLSRGPVGARPVRELIGTVFLNRADGGFLITNGRFTQGARQTAEGTSIQLVEGFGLHDEPYFVREPRPITFRDPHARRKSQHLPPPYWRDMWS